MGADSDTHWRGAGDRIQTLLDASAASGGAARERAEALVAEVVGLYGAALQRITSSLPQASLATLTDDELVASLLLVHGLHPHDVRRRVSDALERVRPYLGSHGGDIELVDVTDDVVRLRFAGNCTSCPSSAVTRTRGPGRDSGCRTGGRLDRRRDQRRGRRRGTTIGDPRRIADGQGPSAPAPLASGRRPCGPASR